MLTSMVEFFLLLLFVIPEIQSMEIDHYNDYQDLAGYVITEQSKGKLFYVREDKRTTEKTETGKLIYKERRLICMSLEADEYKKEDFWVSTRGYGESETGYNKNIMIVRYANDDDQTKVKNILTAFKEKETKTRMEFEKRTLSKVETYTAFEMSSTNEAAGTYTWWLENNNKVYVSYNKACCFRGNEVTDVKLQREEIKQVDIFTEKYQEKMDINGIQYGPRYCKTLKLDNTKNYSQLQEWFLVIRSQGADIMIKKYIESRKICLKPTAPEGETFLDFLVEDDLESHTISLIVAKKGVVDHYALRYAEDDNEQAVPIYDVNLSNGIIYTYTKPTTGENLKSRQEHFQDLVNLLKNTVPLNKYK